MRARIAITLSLMFLSLGAPAQDIKQVSVSVKIIEFTSSKGLETGLSAYFKRRSNVSPYGFVSPGNGAVSAGDATFPASTTAGITVFLNNIADNYGDFEAVLQALIDQNRAFILSRPKAMVPVGLDPATSAPFPPTKIETVQDIPYEKTVVIGATSVQTTDFKPTGVSLTVQAPQVIDDNADPNEGDDTYVQLTLTAGVNEEGQRIIVALDDLLASNSNIFGTTSNAISVPEFVNRTITTTVWLRNGEVLILGGLFRNSESRTLSTLPGLPKAENFLNSAMGRFIPFGVPEAPISSSFGNNKTSTSRRELVFLIKADVWKPVDTVADGLGFSETEEEKPKRSPADVISGVLESLTGIPKGFESDDEKMVVDDGTLAGRKESATKTRKEKREAAAAQEEAEAKKAGASQKKDSDSGKKPGRTPKKAKKDKSKPVEEPVVGQPAPEPPVQEASPVAPMTVPGPATTSSPGAPAAGAAEAPK